MHMVLRRRLLRLQTAYRTGVNTNSASPPRRISQAHILTYTALLAMPLQQIIWGHCA